MTKYDCRGYCTNMKELPIKGREDPYESKVGNPTGYYCSLTDKRCVGALYGSWIWSNDKIDERILERCPSRKTIDDLMPKE